MTNGKVRLTSVMVDQIAAAAQMAALQTLKRLKVPIPKKGQDFREWLVEVAGAATSRHQNFSYDPQVICYHLPCRASP